MLLNHHEIGSYVYVISAKGGPCKIGIAVDPRERLLDIQVSHYLPLHVSFSILAGANAMKVEQYAHWLLRAQRIRGEWFQASIEESVDAVHRAVRDVAEGLTPPITRWTIRNVRSDVRDLVTEAARECGLDVGEWVNRACLGQIERDQVFAEG